MTSWPVTCEKCGQTIDDETPETPPEQRRPCPECGSRDRSFYDRISDEVSTRDETEPQ